MGLIDAIPENGGTGAPTPAKPAAAPAGGLISLIKPQNQPAQAPKAQTPSTPFHAAVPASPQAVPPAMRFFSTVDAYGTAWGPAAEKDQSGLPYLSYKPAGKTATTTDYTRVATAFDPRKAQPMAQGSFTTPRAVANRTALKSAMGGSYSDELDHVISLELAGSNNKANLQIEPNVPGTKNTATDPLENQLAKSVIAGKTSLFQAQWDLAKAKGTPLPYLGETVNKYEEQAYDAGKAATYANSPLGLAENAVGSIVNFARDLGGSIIDHIKATVSSPRGVGAAAAGVTQTAVLKPLSFAEGIGKGIMAAENNVISRAFGNTPNPNAVPQGMFTQISQSYSKVAAQDPEEQKAFDTGQFFGWLMPYGAIARGTEAAIASTNIATYAPKLAPILPYISDAAGFLGTGQVLHTPDEGSRVDQLRNDAIALALFDFGGWALRGGAASLASRLRDTLPSGVAENASKAMEPVVDTLRGGETVSAVQLEAATSRANAIIEEATGRTPKDIVQEHLGINVKSEVTSAEEVAPTGEMATQKPEETASEASASSAIDKTETPLDNNAHVTGENKAPPEERTPQAGETLDQGGAGETPGSVRASESGGTPAEVPKLRDDTAWSRAGFSTKKEYDAALKDIAEYGESPKQEVVRNILSGKVNFKPGTGGDISEWKDILGSRYYKVFKKDASMSIDERASELGYEDAEDLKNDVADEVYRRYNTNPAPKTQTPKTGPMRTLTETLNEPTVQSKEISRSPIELPELPAAKGTLYGVAFPGANTIAKFVQKDIIEKFGSTREALTGIYKATKDLFSTNPTEEKAASVVGSTIQKIEQFASSAWHAAEARRDWWAKVSMDRHLDFIDKMEKGKATYDMFSTYSMGMQRTLADLANEYRDRLDAVYEKEKAAGLEKNYIEDYFPHMWTDPAKAEQFFNDYFVNVFGANYREAFGSFQKNRLLEFIGKGIESGLKLVTSNPEEMVIMREIDGLRAIAKNDMMHELNKAGLAVPLKNMFMDKGMPVVRGVDGRYWGVVPEAKQILDNAFFSPNLWSEQSVRGKIFRGFMAIKGTVVPFQLSLSGFHPFHVQTIASANAISDAFMQILNGNMTAEEGLLQMGKGLSMANTVTDLGNFWNVGHWWDTPMDKLTGEAKTTVQWLIDAGGSPKISDEFRIRAADGFKGALEDENYLGAAIRGVPKLVELMQKPIFEYYVPALKVAAFMREAAEKVKANPTMLTDDLARKVAFREIWGDMDSRFGEMVYKTKFWNPMLTQVGQAGFLSLGWQVGFVDQFLGGALDLGKLAAKSATGSATKSDVTSRMVFAFVYSVQSAMWGGLMTYAMTGKLPQSMQDLFYPNTGNINPDGSAARLNTPFYTREFFALLNHVQKEGLVGGPIAMVKNKLNPILPTMANIYENKDFYGYEVRDTTSPIAQQAADLFKYVIESNLVPISIKGAQQAAPVTGPMGAGLSVAGFNPAPKYIAESAIQTKIFSVLDQRTGGTKPMDTKPAADAKQNIRRLYQQGDIDGANTALDAAVKAGYIQASGKTAFIKALDLPADVRAFKSLAQFPSDQEKLLSEMNEEDLARYANYAASTVKSHLSSLSPTAKKFVDDLQSGKVQLLQFKAGRAVDETP